MPRLSFVLLVWLAVSALACKGNETPTSPSANVPFSTTDIQVGTGTEATNGRVVSVNYTGWLYAENATENKGRQFDTSAGREPLTFTLGVNQVIAGFDRGILGMRIGGRRRLVIPPNLAFGSVGSGGVIPPNATLVFDVELLSIQ